MTVKIPILPIDEFLVASIQLALDDRSLMEFQQALLQRVSEVDPAGVIIDVTAVDLMDSFMARSLNDIATAVQLLGAQVAVVGLQPAVAITLVEMGLSIPNAITALNLQRGIEALRQRVAAEAATRGKAGPLMSSMATDSDAKDDVEP